MHIAKDARHPKAASIIVRIQHLLMESRGKRRRAVSEALGSLPVNIKGPDILPPRKPNILDLSFHDLLRYLNSPDLETFSWHGRTLRYLNQNDTIGCIKFATSTDSIQDLVSEVQWLLYLKNKLNYKNDVFHIPDPVSIEKHLLFRVLDLPLWITNKNQLAKKYPAIVFTTTQTYYQYPNEDGTKGLEKERLKKFL